ncbi:MAG: hypothetical protein ACHQQ3_11705, partial [Gemmatimonadales bacterium]
MIDGRRRRRVRALTAILASCQVTACMGWHPETSPVPVVLEQKHPDEIRVRLKDGREYNIRDPVIRRDSLGTSLGSGSSVLARPAALRDVDQIATRQVALVRTTLYVGACVAISLGLLALIFGSISD